MGIITLEPVDNWGQPVDNLGITGDNLGITGSECDKLLQVPLRPGTVAELGDTLRQGGGQAVGLQGQNSKAHWGNPRNGGLTIISTAALNRILSYEVADLVVTVEAGVKWVDLQGMLAERGQFWPVYPLYPDQATIGGMIATADGGAWRQRYGGVRDGVLGLHWVRPDGAEAKAGGRVVKNVAGYDLMKLLTGAWGTLGCITQATLRLYPLPPVTRSFLVQGADLAVLRQGLLDSALQPTAWDVLSTALVGQLGYPARVSLWLELRGTGVTVAEQVERLAVLCPGVTIKEIAPETIDQLTKILSLPGTQPQVLLKIGVLPARTVALAEYLQQIVPQAWVQLHSGVGLGRCVLAAVPANFPELVTQIREFVQPQGFVSVVAGPNIPDRWDVRGNGLSLMRRVKEQLDPQHRLNPGRWLWD
ncbi:FAD linked oxidase domain-containing protein [Gloeomargarita lithophora Alchichica-D10]|uniref:FAD linked oxidase domain-containing protein n=1 Tax=Gloeomargarita lithophora Alchichica-D10 TaxID=1188229 RepID=A0A1J0ACK5_9CYAN|nr:FAD-binding oxidoreductase [Gloeomargarita lithophora]APB33655.1 FAD linked oxidase domain-containing protein [Gloeomargarita lithophora Alchichica-D10]